MNAAQKKAFVLRMAKARKATAAKKKKPVTDRARTGAGASRKPAKKKSSRPAKSGDGGRGSRTAKTGDAYRRSSSKPARPAAKKNGKKPVTRPARGKSGLSRRGRHNPDDMSGSDGMYRTFHGRAPNRTIEYDETLEYRSEFAELGKLLELRFRDGGNTITLTDFKACQLACTPDGRNLYFVGGNQSVSLEDLGIESDKDYIELGECTYIKYFTRKGFHDFEPVEYWHKLGEEDGIRPVLAYDSINRKLFLLGGNYECKPEGIVN